MKNVNAQLIRISDDLCEAVSSMRFGAPVAYVYNPLDYARAPHQVYLQKYGGRPKDVMLLGMNPGPFGMAQTGVPFGEVGLVRDWLGVEGPVGKPPQEHPKRLVEGFGCTRKEVSGARLWGWARDRFRTPDQFFARFFVANFCPLVFMEVSGSNRTPDKLPEHERHKLFVACDSALRRTVEVLRPRFVVGVGAFAEGRARHALAGLDISIGRILHPSPASPSANRGWAAEATKQLAKLGIQV